MFIRAFAKLLLWLFSSLFLSIGLLLAAWAGWLGVIAQNKTHTALSAFLAFYKANETSFGISATAFGVVVTLVGGAFTLFRAWHSAEVDMPSRLKKFIETVVEKSVIGSRKELLAAVNKLRPAIGATSGTIPVGWWENFQRRPLEQHDRWIEARNSELDGTLNFLTAATSSWSKQKATVHYIKGHRANIIVENLVAKSDSSQQAIRLHRRNALAEFQSAATLDSSDASALELAALQAEALHEYDVAKRHWCQLAELAEERGEWLDQARSLRAQANNLNNKCEGRNLTQAEKRAYRAEARTLLEKAREILGAKPSEESRNRELALACELLGKIRTSSRRYHTAKIALREAQRLFEILNPPDLDAAVRVKTLRSDLDALERAEGNQDSEQTVTSASPIVKVALSYENLGNSLREQGAKAEARAAFNKACDQFRTADQPDLESIARVEAALAEIDDS